MRGTGDSEGFCYDEYEKQEQDDCCDVISWVSQQTWCTGNVGRLMSVVMLRCCESSCMTHAVIFLRSVRKKLCCSVVAIVASSRTWLYFRVQRNATDLPGKLLENLPIVTRPLKNKYPVLYQSRLTATLVITTTFFVPRTKLKVQSFP